jgi:hypothetical protein
MKIEIFPLPIVWQSKFFHDHTFGDEMFLVITSLVTESILHQSCGD